MGHPGLHGGMRHAHQWDAEVRVVGSLRGVCLLAQYRIAGPQRGWSGVPIYC